MWTTFRLQVNRQMKCSKLSPSPSCRLGCWWIEEENILGMKVQQKVAGVPKSVKPPMSALG